MQTINPYSNAVLKTYERPSDELMVETLSELDQGWGLWRKFSFEQRALHVRNLLQPLKERERELALLISTEMGKPLREARMEVKKCRQMMEYYLSEGAQFLEPELLETKWSKSEIRYEPTGIILAIMPWNFPFWQVFRCAIPNLLAGNAIFLKHADNVAGCAQVMHEIFQELGLENPIFASLPCEVSQVERIISDKRVSGVVLTGSMRAGRAVGELAGRHLKKSVLELGGSDPYLILEDADLELAAAKCCESRLMNAGQSCVAAKRFLVHESVQSEFVERMKAHMEKHTWGNPTNLDTLMGPLARMDLRGQLAQQVDQTVKLGAKVVTGGKAPDHEGAFYLPTVLTNIPEGSPAHEEELFGPVASVFSFKTIEEAIRKANETSYGLGGGIFTQDLEKSQEISQDIFCGNFFINDYVKSDAQLPFGGVKDSGYGRELSGHGIREFVNIKTVCVK